MVGVTAIDSLGDFYSVGSAQIGGEELLSGVAEFGGSNQQGCLSDI